MYTVSQNCFKTETDTIANNNDSTQISSLADVSRKILAQSTIIDLYNKL